MLKRLFHVFSAPTDNSSIAKDRIPLAAAVLLLEVAHVNGDFNQTQEKVLGTILVDLFSVDVESLEELLKLAEEARKNSVDLHQYTREINMGFTQPEKEQIIEAVWRVVYADGFLDQYEEAIMRQLGSLIGLSHRQLIDAKLKVAKA